jgi:hypothetical protein
MTDNQYKVTIISTLRNITLLLILLVLVPIAASGASSDGVINLSLSSSKPKRGDTVEVRVQASPGQAVSAVVLTPAVGAQDLLLQKIANQPDTYRSEVTLSAYAPEGMYVVHVWTGPASQPTAVRKASFLLGRLVNDFFVASYVDKDKPAQDIDTYLAEFRQIGGNFLIAHNLVTPNKAYYPSKICKTDVVGGSGNDLVESVLTRADKLGIAVLLSVSWDMTKESPFKDRLPEIKAVAKELYELYRHHPSLAGFYSYQEGSGTYFVPFVREFSQYIKSLDPNLLTACAPHVDDPLLAGYLSTVPELDMIIYQAGVMASYRPDNRKKYPFRRVKDFCSLGSGAKRLQNKIAINHVELFGYLENRLNPQTTATTYKNIYSQILSAATVTGADGISFFTYHAHVFDASKKQTGVERSRAAVVDGLKAFDLITSNISRNSNPLAVYLPYSDWIIERWPNYFLPALDAFRVLGIPVDVLPYAPPLEESTYPYYPFHMNQDVLARLLKEQVVLILPNVSGFQQTDSDLIKTFVEQGGVVIAFGPQIPMGRSYERQELFGIDETQRNATHSAVMVAEKTGERVKAGERFDVAQLQLPSWTIKGARVIAKFEDGSPAITTSKYGKGTFLAILPDALTAAQKIPALVRDVVDYALSLHGDSLLVDVVGTDETTDIAVERTATGFRVAVVNHNDLEMGVVLRPIKPVTGHAFEWIDLVGDEKVPAPESLIMKVPGKGFRAFEYRAKS